MKQSINAFISSNRRFIPVFATAVLFFIAYAIGAGLYQGMRDPQVFLNLFRTSPFLLIAAVGGTFVILTGGIDLSVSGVVALTTVAASALIRAGWDPWVVILLMLIMGMTLGTVLGIFITYMKVQPFIATLAGLWFARGMSFFISDDAIAVDNRVYKILSQTKILIPGLSDPVKKEGAYISLLVVVALVVLALAIYIAQYTRFGRTIYAIGGNNGANEQSARLMGLPVDRTKVLVYTLNGFCSALAGLTLNIYVGSGHGLYATGFELTVIAAVVMGGTMLSGGSGYVFGTLFGVLVLGVTQTLIQFNGRLSSWWTNIVVGALTLIFIGIQSFLAAQKVRSGSAAKQKEGLADMLRRNRSTLFYGFGAIIAVVLIAFGVQRFLPSELSGGHCPLKDFRQEQAANLIKSGAFITYERNGGTTCIDELYAIYPDGKIIGEDGVNKIEKQVTSADVEELLSGIKSLGWFTDKLYSTEHEPCGTCYTYFLSVSDQGQVKTVKAVNGGTDAPPDYWKVIALIDEVIPHFTSAP
jgi:ribose/xylose/arabinose/galactoside ABC-type transport system permease subunit